MKRNVKNINGAAFSFLKGLFPRKHKGERSAIIDEITANVFTNEFRNSSNPFTIPISWTMSKESLVNLLGIVDYSHYPEITGVRLYAGINNENQLTLIAVSTKAGSNCDDDLTEQENYPYYDYADPCPVNCSSLGNLKANAMEQVAAYFTRCI